jgi:2,4-dienoyl-CoA reductase-like NADH-dependent reductase (Old Yellow Enzyme family)
MAKNMKIFNPISLGKLKLKNRLVMAPLLTNLASNDGEVTKDLQRHYERRAEGGVGMIITEGSCIDSKHRMSKNNLGAYSDEFIPSLKDLTNVIHDNGSAVAMQLVHAMGMVDLKVVNASPSDLSMETIKKIIEYFGRAVARALESGFDAVEFHMAHWYTVADFLSLAGNDRTDRYGNKSIETRT